MTLGLNKVTDPNFIIPALLIALIAIFLANRVQMVGDLVYKR